MPSCDLLLKRAALVGSFLGGISTVVIACQAFQLNEQALQLNEEISEIQINLTESHGPP